MLDTVTSVAIGILAISMALCLYRVLVGPSVPDRIIGLDTMAANVMAAIAVVAVKFVIMDYLDAVIIIAMLIFTGTVALAKLLATGRVIDRDIR